jgi:hypothetical protein
MPTIENIVNQALDIVGYPDHVGNIYEGSKASIMALNMWGETRDEVLVVQPWYFARSEALLTATLSTPPAPWTYQFGYPSNSVRLLLIRPATPPVEPTPIRWHEYLDPTIAPPTSPRTVLATIANAYAVFTARVIDPAAWPADFTMAMIKMLARKLATELGRPLPHRPQPQSRGQPARPEEEMQ